MKNIIKPMLRCKTLSSTSSRNPSTQQHSDMFPYKLCQVKSIPSLSGKLSSTQKPLRNSLLMKSSVCKGVVFSPNAANLHPFITKLNLSILLYDPDKQYPNDNPGPGKSEHEKVLEEQQKQLERLKKDPAKTGDDAKFPKYKPQ